jgi:crotonobetainyl-CoA:carnitine CoA-transferase CaiB-like acyl-CoA transferase
MPKLAKPQGKEAMSNILEGIQVVEVASFIAGPSAAVQLSDFGAEVLKIEPLSGDPWRRGHQMAPLMPSKTAYTHLLANRNKKSVALNLKTPEAQQLLYKLVEKADVFLTNSLPHVIKDLNIDYDKLIKINPKLVYALITGFGEQGAEADAPGFDETAWWARTGLMDTLRAKGAEPSLAPTGIGDNNTSVALFAAVMTGLYQRERTGKGCKVSTSLIASGVWTNSIQAQAALVGCAPLRCTSHKNPINPLVGGVYATKDDRRILIMQLNPRNWEPMCDALAASNLKTDERFASPGLRIENADALVAELNALFSQMMLAEAAERLRAAKTNFSVVASNEELPKDQQMIDNGLFPEIEGANGILTVQSPVSVKGIEKATPQPAPEQVGQDTADELKKIGLSDDEIAKLAESGAIGVAR